jgi:hypothetical protein
VLNQQLPFDGSWIFSSILDLVLIGYMLLYLSYCDNDYGTGWTAEEMLLNLQQGQEILFFLQSVQTVSGVHSASYSVDIRSKAVGALRFI